jgi:hypothetical protein
MPLPDVEATWPPQDSHYTRNTEPLIVANEWTWRALNPDAPVYSQNVETDFTTSTSHYGE